MLTPKRIATSVRVNDIVGPSDRERNLKRAPRVGPFSIRFPASGFPLFVALRFRLLPLTAPPGHVIAAPKPSFRIVQ